MIFPILLFVIQADLDRDYSKIKSFHLLPARLYARSYFIFPVKKVPFDHPRARKSIAGTLIAYNMYI